MKKFRIIISLLRAACWTIQTC